MRAGAMAIRFAALALATLALGGCGWFGGNDGQPASAPSSFAGPGGLRDTFPAVARGVGMYRIDFVVPDQGPLAGGNPARVSGSFPPMQTMYNVYTGYTSYQIFFGANPAMLDVSITPAFTASNIYVIVPPGDAPGFVDVRLRDITNGQDAAALLNGYEYIDPFAVLDIDPDMGPVPGGQQAVVIGRFPVVAPISTAAAAYNAFRVYLGGKFAPYDTSFDPIITDSTIRILTPPGDAPGFVDVTVSDTSPAGSGESRTLVDGYEYTDDFDVIAIVPDIGPLSGGQQAMVLGDFPILSPISSAAAAYDAYRVYIDGNPAPFDLTFDPIITAGAIYVLTPPGTVPGLVNVAVADAQSNEFRVLVDGYEYIGELELTDVDPGIGWIFGNEPVTLGGSFPVTTAFSSALQAADANNYYSVFFGPNQALFDVIDPVITPTEMKVLSPPSQDIGFVDVAVFDVENPAIFSRLDSAFRYYAMYITDIVPDQGPLAGGNGVRIEGLISAASTINNVYTAEQYYSVFFGTEQASFANLEPPVIAPSTWDAAAGIYSIGSMYVQAPPGLALGFVDVTIVDDLGIDLPAVAPDGYEYISDDGIGNWIDAEVSPNPVPKLPANELLVAITVSGAIDTAGGDEVFIVPHGGVPTEPNDRIVLEEARPSDTNADGDFVWYGTNPTEIPRRVNGKLVDGHASIFILGASDSGGDADIIGISIADPSDGGRIFTLAQDGRHFIIDTVPPRMLITDLNRGLRAEDFFENFVQNNAFDGRPADIQIATQTHPYPVSLPGWEVNNVDVPTDSGTLNRPRLGSDRAQAFFNAASVANRFYQTGPSRNNLILPDAVGNAPIVVTFEDPDIYTMLGVAPNAFDDTNYFTGTTARQVAGFDLSDVSGPLPLTAATNEREQVLISGDDVQIQWDFQPTFSPLPNMVDIQADYILGDPQDLDDTVDNALDDLTSASGPPTGLDPTGVSGTLTGVFDLGDGTTDSGVLGNSADLRTLMSVVFRAVDRAGDYVVPDVEGDGGGGDRRKIFTRNDPDFINNQQPELGPLNLWWIRDVSTRLRPSFVGSETSIAPEFTWSLADTPPTNAFVESGAEFFDPQPLFKFAIWNTSTLAGLSREEQRNGPYTIAARWSDWHPRTRLTTQGVVDALAVLGNTLEPGMWYLIVVVGADEAGNLEQWPRDQLLIDPANIDGGLFSPATVLLADGVATGDRNWAIWWVPPGEQVVDTRIQPNLWHERLATNNGLIDSNETNFGGAQVVPLPANTQNRRVYGEFRVNLVVPTLADLDNAGVLWRLSRTDSVTGTFTTGTQFTSGNGRETVTITLPFGPDTGLPSPHPDLDTIPGGEGLGDEINRQPVTYIFSATTVVNPGQPDEVVDASPASFQFTVVDNVAQFLRDPDSTQPILQFEREN